MPKLSPLRPSEGAFDFIDDAELERRLRLPPPEPTELRSILAKSLSFEALDLDEVAALLRVEEPELIEELLSAAQALKTEIYGNRVVIFAPLYLGNECVNDCAYCGFRVSNRGASRHSLGPEQVSGQVRSLLARGHKRLILVFGEHPRYDAQAIAASVRQVYGTREGRDDIRRVNINAAPLDVEGFRKVKEAGIGTYQIFMETYHHETYARVHPARTRKADYLYRLDGLDRAMQAGLDDVGLGALFGLYDWRFEVLGLVRHALHLEERFGVGPHTISFPRLRPAPGVDLQTGWEVSDEDFERLVAILRLAVPYTGLILTAREPAEIRRRALALGVSQIDAGSRIDLGGYTEAHRADAEQFSLGDTRGLDVVLRELLEDGYLPSFCTACYRLGRTGEHFMEVARPGHIHTFCTPNALLTLEEYLQDFASEATRDAGKERIAEELGRLPDGARKAGLQARLERIRGGERDIIY